MSRLLFIAPLLLCAAACKNSIGDSCSVGTDCSSRGDRTCDPDPISPGGYCTIRGCDHDTCPGEAVCVRFFSVGATNRPCDPDAVDLGTSDCSPDELCTMTALSVSATGGVCVPRTAEDRFCMRKCNDSGDCRVGYECRDEELMREHGGEPVPAPDRDPSEALQGFCAAAPVLDDA